MCRNNLICVYLNVWADFKTSLKTIHIQNFQNSDKLYYEPWLWFFPPSSQYFTLNIRHKWLNNRPHVLVPPSTSAALKCLCQSTTDAFVNACGSFNRTINQESCFPLCFYCFLFSFVTISAVTEHVVYFSSWNPPRPLLTDAGLFQLFYWTPV